MKFASRVYRRLAIKGGVSFGAEFHVGPGTRVWAPRSLIIGHSVYIGKFCTVETDGTIGDGVLIANNVGIIGRTDHDLHEIGVPISRARWVGEHPNELGSPVSIGSDVWIGFGATVLSGVTVGDSVIVAAGSVVAQDLPENTVCVGVPAKPVKARFSSGDWPSHWKLLRRKGFRPLAEIDAAANR
jgi:acetyltransferase-like isoleucine patch superfamily enzyme